MLLMTSRKRDYFGFGGRKKGKFAGRFKGNWNVELFNEEIGRQCEVVYFGKGYGDYYTDQWNWPIQKIVDHYNIDVVFTCDMSTKWIEFNQVDVFKVHLCGDYYRGVDRKWKYDEYFDKLQHDMYFMSNMSGVEMGRKEVSNEFYYLPFSCDTNWYKNWGFEKIYDVFTGWQQTRVGIYPLRKKIVRMLMDTDINGYYNEAWFCNHVKKINESKICLMN